MKRLKNFAYNIESQWGDDGVIEEIFKRIGEGNKTCVDFGAYDGPHLSNTWNLWNNKGWNALLIEGNPGRVKSLREYTEGNSKIKIVNAFVTISGENKIDNIVEKNLGSNTKIDLMSIDIDGDDYYIMESIEKFLPRVIVIEFNPTIPAHIDIVQEPGEYFGSSANSINKLATKKGYKLIEIIGANCYFIREEEYSKVYAEEFDLNHLFHNDFISHIITSYGGYSFILNKLAFSSKNKLVKKPSIISSFQFVDYSNLFPQKLSGKIADIKKVMYQKYLAARINYFNRNRPVPHEYKSALIIKLAKRYGIKNLIETGTYQGKMVYALRHVFKKIYSIEIDKALFAGAVERFKHYPYIKIINGDSGVELKKILSGNKEKFIFWLDGHYSAGHTGKAELNTPVIKELETIFANNNKHIIAIDDARLFNGKDDYPQYSTIKQLAGKNGYSSSIKKDIIILLPNDSTN